MKAEVYQQYLKPKRWFSVFAMCFFIALISWINLKLSKTYTVKIKYNIEYLHHSKDFQIEKESDSLIYVSVKDNGFNLLLNKFFPNSNTLTVDVSKYLKKENNTFTLLSKEVLSSVIHPNKEVLSSDSIRVYYSKRYQKRVPVMSLVKYQPEKQYFVSDSCVISPDSVWICGSKDDLNKINYVTTQLFTISNLNTTYFGHFSLKSNYKSKNSIEISPAQTSIYIPIEKYTESLVHCKIDNSYDDSYELKTFPNLVTITFHVGVSKYKSIVDTNFSAKVDFSAHKGGNKAPLVIYKYPKHIQIIKVNPEMVEYLIVKK